MNTLMNIGTRVRLKGKKRMAYVRRVRHTSRGVEVLLSNALRDFVWWDACELEVI